MGQPMPKMRVGVQVASAPTRTLTEEEKFNKNFKRIVINNIKDGNGLILQGQPIPEEVLVRILETLDFNTLLKCRRICKLWFLLVEAIIKKRILNMWQNPPVDEKVIWNYLNTIWGANIMYGEDLIKLQKPRWIFCDRGIDVGSWQNVHDMDEYHTHYLRVDDVPWKQHDIDLYEWFPQYILETIKPTIIKVWDFYWCPKDKCGKYEFKIELIKSVPSHIGNKDIILDSYSFSQNLEDKPVRDKWYKLSRQFVIYEEGFNKIKFYHDFKDGVKVGGSTVIVQFPSRRKMRKLDAYKIDN